VVFDGRERGGLSGGSEKSGGIGIRYSRQGETADEVIAHLVVGAGDGAVVVSSDREVQGAARRHGAAPLSAEEFIARMDASRVASLKGGDEKTAAEIRQGGASSPKRSGARATTQRIVTCKSEPTAANVPDSWYEEERIMVPSNPSRC
jgi:predicted RNA-binding protein with PIN domain